MCQYNHISKDIDTFLQETYDKGLQCSNVLGDVEVKRILHTIGIFRFKGYLYAFRNELNRHSIDDVLTIYYFDKFLTRYIMELTSTIETILKTRLVETCYQRTDNPFFYLIDANHKYRNFKINKASLNNWRHRRQDNLNEPERILSSRFVMMSIIRLFIILWKMRRLG